MKDVTYKLSLHGGKGFAAHNDLSTQPIEPGSDKDNRYWVIGQSNVPAPGESLHKPNRSFYSAEMDYYHEHYRDFLWRINENYITSSHPERTKTMQQIYKSPKYAPHELIVQIGNEDTGSPSPAELWRFAMWLKTKLESAHVHVLDVAMHCHETTPHLHIRYVIDYINAHGERQPCVDAGLKLDGIQMPDKTAKSSRYNNRLQSWHGQLRDDAISYLREQGYSIDDRVSKKHRKYQTVAAHRRGQQLDEIAKNEQIMASQDARINEQEGEMRQNNNIIQQQRETIAKHKDKATLIAYLDNHPEEVARLLYNAQFEQQPTEQELTEQEQPELDGWN